ncbi:MAG TPA: PilZ domain-containing protein [Croceibacterium sp.]|nr:PilZ domain-containing protein [Croceibacterium sp.]
MKHQTFPPENARTAADPRREDARAEVGIFADVRVGYGEWQKARLSDVSATGFRVAWLPRAAEGNAVAIRLPGLEPLKAIVRWKDGNAVGCQFERPLSVYVFEHLVRSAS